MIFCHCEGITAARRAEYDPGVTAYFQPKDLVELRM